MTKETFELELDILLKRKAAILARCDGWQRCNDGSYEMALSQAGFDSVCKQIAALRESFETV